MARLPTTIGIDLSAAAFMQPDSLAMPPAWAEHIPFAFWLIDKHRPNILVELGTHTGNSYLAFCQAVARVGASTRCFAVDTWAGDEHAGAYGDEIFETLALYHSQRYSGFSRLVRSTFDAALTHFTDASVDLLHIDGLHTYEAVKHDFDTWLPKVSARGVVLFHDTNVRENGFGVFRLWEELSARYPHFEFTHGHGLGVLGVGAALGPDLKALFAAGADDTARAGVREAFARLGRTFTQQVQLEQEEAGHADTKKQFAHLSAHYQSQTARADGLAAELAELSRARDALRDEAAQIADHYRLQSLRADGLAAELAGVLQARDALRTEAAQIADHYQLQSVRADGLAAELAGVLQARDELRDEVGRLAEHYRLQSARADGLEAELAETARAREVLKAHVALVEEHYEAMSARAETHAAEAARLGEQYRTAERTVAALHGEVRAISGRAESLAVEVGALAVNAEQSRTDLAALAASVQSPRWLARKLVGAIRKKVRMRGAIMRKSLLAPTKTAAETVTASGLFDAPWYLAQYPDVAAAGADPLAHYLATGASEERDPNPVFRTAWYLERNEDVARAGFNPLVHYVLSGAAEGRWPGPEFDPDWYGVANPDVAASGAAPLLHYLRHGRAEGRQALKSAHEAPGHAFLKIVRTHTIDLTSVVAPMRPLARDERQVDVIVPVYRGLAQTQRCIDSALRSRPRNESFGRLILVDDKSPEPEVSAYLREVAARDGVTLLVNPENLGFVGTVNRAMREAGQADVVLLNSDTEVAGDWLDRMGAQAQSDPKIATVTPFSNNATICSFPDIGGGPNLPEGATTAVMHAAFAAANGGRSVDIPTGVGFCMYIKRACLDAIGPFDEAAFGKGYGEETDFCCRAAELGWRHILAGDVHVFHAGGVSFGASADALKSTAGAIMRQRYPHYDEAVAAWVSADPALPLRIGAEAALLRAREEPVVLHLTHPWGGGTERQIADLIAQTALGAHHLVLVAVRQGDVVALSLLIPMEGGWRKVSTSVADLAAAAPWISAFGVTQAHVHHTLEVFDDAPAFLAELGVPFDVSVHDYALVCPRINLVRGGKTYCGEPSDIECVACLAEDPAPRARDIIWWRERGVSLLEDAGRVICPSADVADRIGRFAPGANLVLAPHEPDLYRPSLEVTPPQLHASENIRVAALGVFAEHKGGGFLLDCIAYANSIGAPISWHVIGSFPSPLATRAASVGDALSVTGSYTPEALDQLIVDADPHLIFFPQRCPETYSYTLSEAFKSGRPILAPALGALEERIEGLAWHWLYEADESPASVVKRILTLRKEAFEPGKSMPIPIAPRDARTAVQMRFYRDSYILPQAR